MCGRVPFPPADGGTLAVNNITQGLISQGCTVNVFALNTKKHWVDVEQLSPSYRKALLDTIAINTNIKPTDALLNLFGTQSYHVTRFFSTKAQERLIELLQKQQFDIIHVEGLFMSVYLTAIRNNTKAPVVLRAHNIEYKIWEHMAANERKPAKRLYLKLLAKRLKAYEKKAINQFDAVVTITQADADHYKELGCIKPLYVCPFGVDSNSLKRTGISPNTGSRRSDSAPNPRRKRRRQSALTACSRRPRRRPHESVRSDRLPRSKRRAKANSPWSTQRY